MLWLCTNHCPDNNHKNSCSEIGLTGLTMSNFGLSSRQSGAASRVFNQVAMSGPIRRLIGPAKSQVLRVIEEANAFLETGHKGEDLDKDKMDAESLINRLTVNISTLERCNKDWMGVLKDLKGEAKTAEEREYDRVADGDKGFIDAIIVGNEVVAKLKAKITFTSRKRDKATLEASRVSTLTSSQTSMIEQAAVQTSRAAVQESLSLS